MKILETARLRLRTMGEEDAAFYLEVVTDPAFIRYIGERGIHTVEAARQAVAQGPVAMQAARGHSLYLVELKQGAVPIGMCGLIKRAALDDVDLGYAFLPPWRGCGYAFEAAAAVLGYARSLGLQRVAAIVSPDNAASIRLLYKLGMRFQYFTHLTPDDPGTNLYLRELGEDSPRADGK